MPPTTFYGNQKQPLNHGKMTAHASILSYQQKTQNKHPWLVVLRGVG